MKISLENQIRLKTLIRHKDKKLQSSILAKEIEQKEKNILSHITKDYLNIIERCNDLKEIKDKLPFILEKNEDIVMKTKEVYFEITNIEKELSEMEDLERRINELVNELGIFVNFFALVNEKVNVLDELYFYKLTNNLVNTKMLVEHFQNYKFYEEIVEISNSHLKKSNYEIYKFFTEYKDFFSKNYKFLGEQIIEVVKKYNPKPKYIFNDLLAMRNKLILPSLLEIIYMTRKLDKLDEFVCSFNLERKNHLKDFSKNKDILLFFTTEILNSFFLVKLNTNFMDFYEFILENINDYFVNDDTNLIISAQDTIISIKMLMNILGIEQDGLEETVGRFTIEYFSKSFIDKNETDRKKLRKEIMQFIDQSSDFINKFKNEEINEIFVNKVDLHLKDFISTSNKDLILEDEMFINEIINKINKVFPNINFRSSKYFNKKIESFRFQLVNEKSPELENIFRENKNFNVKLQDFMNKYKNLKKEFYELIKVKFIDMIYNCKEDNIEAKREVAGKVTCFYKYLIDNDKYLSDDFKNVCDEANKF